MSLQTLMLEGEYHSLQILSLWRCQMLLKCGICYPSRKLSLLFFCEYLLCSDSVTYVLLKPCLLNINHYITFSLCSFSALSVIYDCRDCFITI